jgi:hypothetical protein
MEELLEVVISKVEPLDQLENAAFDTSLRSASLPLRALTLIADGIN